MDMATGAPSRALGPEAFPTDKRCCSREERPDRKSFPRALTPTRHPPKTDYCQCSVLAPPAEFRVDGCESLIISALEGALEAIERVAAITRLGLGSGETDQRVEPSRV